MSSGSCFWAPSGRCRVWVVQLFFLSAWWICPASSIPKGHLLTRGYTCRTSYVCGQWENFWACLETWLHHFIFSTSGSSSSHRVYHEVNHPVNFHKYFFKTLRRNEVERDQGGGLSSACPKKADDGATRCQTQRGKGESMSLTDTLINVTFPIQFPQWRWGAGRRNYKKFIHNPIPKYLIDVKVDVLSMERRRRL